MNQEELNRYFSKEWTSDFDNYPLSGFDLKDKIRKNDWVLDVGCGHNPFKGAINNLVAIDPAFPQADINTTIEDFESDRKFDVAFCLGSINFGDEHKIRKQIAKICTHLKPKCKIFWRCNPGRRDHGKPSTNQVPFFTWSEGWHYDFAKEFGFVVNEIGTEVPEPNKVRIYAEWEKQ